jgi:hypothetical protein
MQFTGKKGIAAFAGIVAVSCGVGFGSGLLVGRQFPQRHYERMGETHYLLDSATGKVCDLSINPNQPFSDLVDTGKKDANGFSIVSTAYPPACAQMKEK